MSSDPTDNELEAGAIISRAEQDIAASIEKRLPPDLIEPQELARALAEIVSVEIREVAYSFRGPMPHPSLMREYETALPGLAERIAIRSEKEQDFRHEVARFEMKAVDRSQTIEAIKVFVGQALAFIIALTAIGGGIGLLAYGKGTAGLVAIIAALVALVAVFITGKVVELLQKRSDTSSNDSDDENSDDE